MGCSMAGADAQQGRPGQRDRRSEIGLVEAIASIRAELSEAVAAGLDQDVQFPVEGVDLEFQVGVTRSASGSGGLRFWVFELGAEAGYEDQSVHTVTVRLGAPVDALGETVKVRRLLPDKP